MGLFDFFKRTPSQRSLSPPSADEGPAYPHSFPLDGRFVYPDWADFFGWMDVNVPRNSAAKCLDRHLLKWVSELSDRLDNSYTIYSTERVLFMTESKDEEVEKTVRFADDMVARIPRELPGLRHAPHLGRFVFLQFEGRELYGDYASHFTGPGTFGQSDGMAIRSGYPHIILLPGMLSGLKAILAHEILHVHTSGLNLPRWLDEGLAQRMESLSDEMVWKREDGNRNGRTSRVWNPTTIQHFWEGSSFFAVGEMQEASYALALDLHDSLAVDGEAFQKFVGTAQYEDAGDAACRGCFGHTLGEALKPLLGPGLWGVGAALPEEAAVEGLTGDPVPLDSEAAPPKPFKFEYPDLNHSSAEPGAAEGDETEEDDASDYRWR